MLDVSCHRSYVKTTKYSIELYLQAEEQKEWRQNQKQPANSDAYAVTKQVKMSTKRASHSRILFQKNSKHTELEVFLKKNNCYHKES